MHGIAHLLGNEQIFAQLHEGCVGHNTVRVHLLGGVVVPPAEVEFVDQKAAPV